VDFVILHGQEAMDSATDAGMEEALVEAGLVGAVAMAEAGAGGLTVEAHIGLQPTGLLTVHME